MGQAVARALRAIDRHKVRPEEIDGVIIAAINVTLCLASSGDDRVAEGFNSDVGVSGGRLGCRLPDRTGPRVPERRCRSPRSRLCARRLPACVIASPAHGAYRGWAVGRWARACSQRYRLLPPLPRSTRWFELGSR